MSNRKICRRGICLTVPISLDSVQIAGRYHQRRNYDKERNGLLLLRRCFFSEATCILIALKLRYARCQDRCDSSVLFRHVPDNDAVASYSLLECLKRGVIYQCHDVDTAVPRLLTESLPPGLPIMGRRSLDRSCAKVTDVFGMCGMLIQSMRSRVSVKAT